MGLRFHGRNTDGHRYFLCLFQRTQGAWRPTLSHPFSQAPHARRPHPMSERASQAITGHLRETLIAGELGSGALVSEAQLSGLLGCGWTPLREAARQPRRLLRFGSVGWPIPRPGCGVHWQPIREMMSAQPWEWRDCSVRRTNNRTSCTPVGQTHSLSILACPRTDWLVSD
jgi:hypothetical protein